MIYGFIIAAGNQSRFESEIPKALVEINGEKCLDLNIDNLSSYCDKVYVVCSNNNKQWFSNYPNKICIDSGLGCGDAVLKALSYINFNEDDTCFIQWGDAIMDPNIYKESIEAYVDKCIIPCNEENKPYVQVVQTDNNKIEIKFSKFNDNIDSVGFHDCSVFYDNCNSLKSYVYKFKETYYNNNSYNHIHGNEFNFLDIFNEGMPGQIIITTNKSYGFNTINQVAEIERSINGNKKN